MGDHGSRGVGPDQLGPAIDECCDVLSGEGPPIDPVGVAEDPGGGPHVVPAGDAASPGLLQRIKRSVALRKPVPEGSASRRAVAEGPRRVLGQVDPHVGLIDGLPEGQGRMVGHVCCDPLDEGGLELLDFCVIGTEPRPATGRSIGTLRGLEGQTAHVHIPILRILANRPLGAAVEVEQEAHSQLIAQSGLQELVEVAEVDLALPGLERSPDQPGADRVEAGLMHGGHISRPIGASGSHAAQVLGAEHESGIGQSVWSIRPGGLVCRGHGR